MTTTITNRLVEALTDFSSSYQNSFIWPHQSYDIYEVYVLMLILEAAREEGATISFQPQNGNDLTFRTSPGQIYNGQYCYATLDFSQASGYLQRPNKNSILEVHLGIRVKGKSEILHECDVCVLENDKAETCRTGRRSPKSREILAAVECKCYEKTGLGIKLGREFIGLTSEFESGSKRISFVANSSSDNISRLLNNQNREWYLNVLPSSQTQTNQNQTKSQSLVSHFEKIFKKYKAR